MDCFTGLDEEDAWRRDTRKSSEKEWQDGNVDDRRCNVDEPIWKNGRHAQEENIVEQISSLLLNLKTLVKHPKSLKIYLLLPSGQSFRNKSHNQRSTHRIRQIVAHRRTASRTLKD